MSAPVYFQGQRLPDLRPGKVWGMLLYPGGRKEVKQFSPDQLQTPDQAARKLTSGEWARVWLDDAALTMLLWKGQAPNA